MFRNIEYTAEEASGGGRAIDYALRPLRGKAGVVVGVKVGEEVGD